MNVKFYFLSLVAALVAVGCNVDESYDLTDVSFDDVEIGSDESVFTVPIATITLTSDDLDGTGSGSSSSSIAPSTISAVATRATSDLSFSDILTLVNAFLPSDTEINISELIDESTKEEAISNLVDDLVVELQNDEQKVADLAAVIDEYKDNIDDSVFEAIGLDSSETYTVEDITEAVETTLSSDVDVVDKFISDITNVIDVDVVSQLEEYSAMGIDQEIDAVEIPSEILDALGGDDETVSIIATYTHNFPFTFDVDEITLTSGTRYITLELTPEGEDIIYNTFKISEISSVLSDGATLSSGISLNTYTSVSGGDYAIVIKIAIQKSGSLKF